MTAVDDELVPSVYSAGLGATRVERDVIRVVGPDAVSYLEGQLSQAVGALESGGSGWSFLLQPTGKVDAWLRVSRLGDQELLLDLDAGAGAAALARLQRFLLRTDATLTLESWSMIAIRGAGASALGPDDVAGAVLVADAAWPGIEGVDALGPDVQLPPGITIAGMADLEALRIASGVPAMGRELHEGVIPAETGVVARSVSFTKGCYTGQELVARIDSRGNNVPRRLRLVVVEGSAAVGDAVEAAGDAVGVLTSVAPIGDRTVGLAYLGRAVDPPCDARVGGSSARILPVGD